MVQSANVGAVNIVINSNTLPYVQGLNRAQTANRQFAVSVSGLAHASQQFTNSLRSSLIATAAYAAGVNAVRLGVQQSVGASIEFERGLISVQKTAGLTSAETVQLGDNFRALVTETSSLGQALPVTRQELTDIATVAGQMNIQGVRNISTFTEAVALLGLTSDLVGAQAANALGRIIATTRATADESLRIASTITALGNEFRGGESEIVAQATFLATQTAAFNLPTEDVLAFSAALTAGGQRVETAGTAFQRLAQNLTDAAAEAASGDFSRLEVIARNLGDEVGTLDERVLSLRRNITSGDYTAAFLQFLQALRNAGPEGAGGIITGLFGGETPPTRLAGTFGFLAANIDEVNRALGRSRGEYQDVIALLEEAGLFAQSYALRLRVVQNQLSDQFLSFGNFVTPTIVNVAENFRTIELGLFALAGSQAWAFINRRYRSFRSQSRDAAKAFVQERTQINTQLQRQGEITQRANTQIIAAQQRQSDAQRRITEARRRAVRGGGTVSLFGGVSGGLTSQAQSRAQGELQQAERQFAEESKRNSNIIASSQQQSNRSRNESNRLVLAQRQNQSRYNRVVRLGGRALRGLGTAVSFLGGPIGVLTGAVLAGGAAWNFWRNSVEAAERPAANLRREIERLSDAATDEEGGLDRSLLSDREVRNFAGNAEELRKTYREQIDGLRDDTLRIQNELSQILSDPANIGRADARVTGLRGQLARNRAETERLSTAYRDLGNSTLELAGGQEEAAEQAQAFRDAQVRTFQDVNKVFAEAEANARRLVRSFSEASGSEVIQAQFELDISTRSDRDQAIATAARQVEIKDLQTIRRAEAQLESARSKAASLRSIRADQVEERERLANDKQFELANRAIATTDKQIRQADQRVRSEENVLNVLQRGLFETRQQRIEDAQGAVLLRRRAEIGNLLRPAQTSFSLDIDADSFRELEMLEELTTRLRFESLQNLDAGADPIISAGVRASEAVILPALMRQSQAAQQLEFDEKRLNAAKQISRRLDGELRAAGDNASDSLRERVRIVKQFIEDTGRSIAVQRFDIQTTKDAIPGYRELAESQRQAAEARETFNQALRVREALEPPQFRQVDRSSITRQVDDIISEFNREFNRSQRNQRQEISFVSASSGAEEARLRAQTEVNNRIDDRRVEILRRLQVAQQELTDAQNRNATSKLNLRFADGLLVVADTEAAERAKEAVINAQEQVDAVSLLKNNFDELVPSMRRVADAQGDLAAQGFRGPLEQLIVDAGRLEEKLEQLTADTLNRFGDELASIFQDGKFELDSFLETLGSGLIRALIQDQLISPLSQVISQLGQLNSGGGGGGIFGSLFGGGGGGGGGIFSFIGSLFGGIFHDGGVVGKSAPTGPLPQSAPFRLAPRERMTILEVGEEVITRRDPRHRYNIQKQTWESLMRWMGSIGGGSGGGGAIPKFHSGGVVGGSYGSSGGSGNPGFNVSVNLVNESGRQLEAEDGGVQFDAEGFVTSILLKDARRRGPISQAMAGGRR